MTTTPVDVRVSLQDALCLDLVGPRGSLGTPDETLFQAPSRWYLTGFLVPTEAEDLRLGCPAVCPTGVFGGSIVWLMENENHHSDKYGNSGMVYWADSTLRYIADLDIIQPAR